MTLHNFSLFLSAFIEHIEKMLATTASAIDY